MAEQCEWRLLMSVREGWGVELGTQPATLLEMPIERAEPEEPGNTECYSLLWIENRWGATLATHTFPCRYESANGGAQIVTDETYIFTNTSSKRLEKLKAYIYVDVGGIDYRSDISDSLRGVCVSPGGTLTFTFSNALVEINP